MTFSNGACFVLGIDAGIVLTLVAQSFVRSMKTEVDEDLPDPGFEIACQLHDDPRNQR